MNKKEKNITSIQSSIINRTSTILKNKKIISSQKKKNMLTNSIKINHFIDNKNIQTTVIKKNMPHTSISFNKLKNEKQTIIKTAYVLMKKDIYIKILEKKFNIKWTEDNINIL